jgi:hypothetical protein
MSNFVMPYIIEWEYNVDNTLNLLPRQVHILYSIACHVSKFIMPIQENVQEVRTKRMVHKKNVERQNVQR